MQGLKSPCQGPNVQVSQLEAHDLQGKSTKQCLFAEYTKPRHTMLGTKKNVVLGCLLEIEL